MENVSLIASALSVITSYTQNSDADDADAYKRRRVIRVGACLLLYAVWYSVTAKVAGRAGPWGPRWLARGLAKNVVAVAVPVACTIFLTDTFDRWMKEREAHAARSPR